MENINLEPFDNREKFTVYATPTKIDHSKPPAIYPKLVPPPFAPTTSL
jgi:hypothetical protein